MKKLLILALCLAIMTITGKAQENKKSAFNSGGFGHFFLGPSYVQQSSQLKDYLKTSSVIGNAYNPSAMGYLIGGEGFGMMNKLLIGGGGYGVVMPTTITDSGNATQSFAGGYFKVGYKFFNTTNSFMFGYAGFGGSGYALQISNLSDEKAIAFNRKNPIAPGKKDVYGVGGFLLDAGIGFKTLGNNNQENRKSRGGFMIGLDLGCTIMMPMTEWSHETDAVSGPPSPASAFIPYVKLTIGGGGFRNN